MRKVAKFEARCKEENASRSLKCAVKGSPGAPSPHGSWNTHKSHPLLVETLLALFSRDIAMVDRADFRRRRALVQVLHKLAQRALLALSFPSDL